MKKNNPDYDYVNARADAADVLEAWGALAIELENSDEYLKVSSKEIKAYMRTFKLAKKIARLAARKAK